MNRTVAVPALVAALAVPVLAAALLLCAAPAQAAVPRTTTFALRVFDPEQPGGWSYAEDVQVNLCAAAEGPCTGASSLWTELHSRASVEMGHLALELGSVNTVRPLADLLTARAGLDTWIQLTFGVRPALAPPRVKLTSVPYALACGDAATLGGLGQGEFSLAGHGHAWSEIGDKPAFLADGAVSWTEIQGIPASFPPSGHRHDWSAIDGVPATFAPAAHTHGAADVASGTLDAARIPNLDAGKIATGTLADARIPNLNASKITAGTLATDRFSAYADLQAESKIGSGADQVLTLASLKALVGLSTTSDADFGRDLRNLITEECPPGYTRITQELDGSCAATGAAVNAGWVVCARGCDQMVKVGDFWADRYEGVIVSGSQYAQGRCNGSGTPYAQSSDPGAAGWAGYGFPQDGNGATRLYACSLTGVIPSRWMTWFQAAQACAASGKRLITNGEWQAAAAGTVVSDCNTGGSGVDGYNGSDPEPTGSMAGPGSTGCVSKSGAFDMVGNLWEWVDMWGVAGPQPTSFADGLQKNPWPTGTGIDYGGDATWNVAGRAYNGSAWVDGVPAAALRGGGWGTGASAGVFALYLAGAPSNWPDDDGFRCSRTH